MKLTNTDPKTLAFYLRVSRTKQEFFSQFHALKEFCRRSGWRVPPKDRIFSEKITGKLAKRTQLDRLLQACRDGHVDTILAYRVDRMGNSALHLHNLIAQLDGLKVRLVGAADNIDTAINNSATAMWRSMVIGMAESQRILIQERTIAGLKAARARGFVGGRVRKNDAAIGQAFALKEKGKLSVREIAQEVGLSAGYLSRIFNGHRPKK